MCTSILSRSWVFLTKTAKCKLAAAKRNCGGVHDEKICGAFPAAIQYGGQILASPISMVCLMRLLSYFDSVVRL
jgi:hypothetical protein